MAEETQLAPLPQGTSSALAVTGAPSVPDWLSTKMLSKKRYLAASTGNLHGLMGDEFLKTKWPLPKMFGEEKYAYSLIDIEDPRYLTECTEMAKKLIQYFYDQQIFDLEWRKTYKELIVAEKRRANLPPNASSKAKEELDKNVTTAKKYLLELQEQKDLYQRHIDEIFERCSQIKRSIKKENDLEDLREEMSNRVRQRYDQDDSFWKTQFNARQEGADGKERLMLDDY